MPPDGGKRFHVVVEGVNNGDLLHAWSDLCQPRETPPDPEFKAVYPYVTTVQGNRFRFRGGDPQAMRENLQQAVPGPLPRPGPPALVSTTNRDRDDLQYLELVAAARGFT